MYCVKNDAQDGINARADDKLCWLAYGDINMDANNRLAIVCPLHQSFLFHFMIPQRDKNETMITSNDIKGE